jgi:hypothetical protein
MRVENKTPFAAAWLVLLDKQAAEHLIFVLKATYTIAENGKLEIAKKQDPIRPADEFYGEPGKSSIRYEAELGPAKVATDVVLIGSAVAPQPGTTEMDVALRVGQASKHVKVFGERRWKKSLLGHSISKPLPFERIPLIYENAYGGKDVSGKDPKLHGQELRNPVGLGYRAKKSDLNFTNTPLPNIEDPAKLLRHPGQDVSPQGFGFIGRDWQPRLGYAGTYDEKWKEERMPLLPLDFDERFHNSAHPDLIVRERLKGGELVEAFGCTRGGKTSFQVPTITPRAMVSVGGTRQPLMLALDTVMIGTDAMKLCLLWKGTINIHRRLPQLTLLTCECAR